MGTVFAVFQEEGKYLKLRVILNMSVISCMIVGGRALRASLGMPLGLGTLFLRWLIWCVP